MNKEAVIVILDCNPTMNKKFTAGGDKQTRFQLGVDSVRMLLQQKVSAVLLVTPVSDALLPGPRLRHGPFRHR